MKWAVNSLKSQETQKLPNLFQTFFQYYNGNYFLLKQRLLFMTSFISGSQPPRGARGKNVLKSLLFEIVSARNMKFDIMAILRRQYSLKMVFKMLLHLKGWNVGSKNAIALILLKQVQKNSTIGIDGGQNSEIGHISFVF